VIEPISQVLALQADFVHRVCAIGAILYQQGYGHPYLGGGFLDALRASPRRPILCERLQDGASCERLQDGASREPL